VQERHPKGKNWGESEVERCHRKNKKVGNFLGRRNRNAIKTLRGGKKKEKGSRLTYAEKRPFFGRHVARR